MKVFTTKTGLELAISWFGCSAAERELPFLWHIRELIVMNCLGFFRPSTDFFHFFFYLTRGSGMWSMWHLL